ncbi:MAG: NRDE family protein [Deltaproteobacteria bacterium]|nr:NRDE family protein [Deltaproteobacteria bacterium]MBW2659690.1 NRDE family protein [Deltaproteobacteria bacterium]
MCLLFLSYKTTPGYRLVVAANRDEFLNRPAASLDFIGRDKCILAGLDLEGGGTWLGVNKEGKFAALTNYREGGTQMENAPSRGEIICSYLSSSIPGDNFLHELKKTASTYNGFNLVLGEGEELFYYTNKHNSHIRLEPGFYGLSNHLLDTPWPKLSRGKDLLRPAMVETGEVKPGEIFSLLRDQFSPPDNLLPDTGIGLEWERLLGSIFIKSPLYGTRSSAVITFKDNGQVNFAETTYLKPGAELSAQGHPFKSQVINLSFNLCPFV